MFNTSNCSINQNATYVLTKKKYAEKLLQIMGSRKRTLVRHPAWICATEFCLKESLIVIIELFVLGRVS